MKLRTEITIPESRYRFGSGTKVLTIGSCFSDVLGSKLTDNKLTCQNNPFGTIFNPISIFKLLINTLEDVGPSNHLYVNQNDEWFHHDFHSKFRASQKASLTAQLFDSQKTAKNFLKNVDYIVITLGTAIGYQTITSKQFVANCHKVPQSQFTRNLITSKEILNKFDQFEQSLRKINKKAKIILTVSPVRHTKETLQLNSVSKATLRMVCHQICEQYPQTEYFPSFEILMDDLRDYRFYKDDMIHPTELAEKIVFKHFMQTYFTKDLQILVEDWQRIKKSLNHIDLSNNSLKYQEFLKDLIKKLSEMNEVIDVSNEISSIQEKLILEN